MCTENVLPWWLKAMKTSSVHRRGCFSSSSGPGIGSSVAAEYQDKLHNRSERGSSIFDSEPCAFRRTVPQTKSHRSHRLAHSHTEHTDLAGTEAFHLNTTVQGSVQKHSICCIRDGLAIARREFARLALRESWARPSFLHIPTRLVAALA